MASENDISGKVGLDYADFQRGVTAMNQQIKNIEVSFRGSAATMDDWSNTTEGLQARITSLNDKMALQKATLKALTDEFNLLGNAEGDHSAEQQRLAGQMNSLERQINSTQGEIRKYSTSLDEIDGSANNAGGEIQALGDDFDDTGKKALSFGDVLKANILGDAIISGIKAIGGAVKGLVSNFFDAAASGAEYADTINTLSAQTGLATDTIQGMAYASDILDVDIETQAKGMAKVVSAIGDAAEAGEDYITATGGITVSIKDQNGNLKSTEQVYYDTIDALGDMTDATAREAAAQDIFGKSYQDLMPLINAGSEGLKAFKDEAEESGYILSTSALTSLNAYQDSLDRLTNSKTSFTNALGVAMAPAMETFATSAVDASTALTQLVNGSINAGEFSEKISGIVTNLTDEINANLPALLEVAGSILTAVADGIIAALPTLAAAATSILIQLGESIIASLPMLTDAAINILMELGNAVITNLPLLIEAALQIILQLANSIAESLPELIPTIVDVILQIVDTLIENIDLLIDASIAIIVALAEGLVAALPKLIEKAPEIMLKLVTALIKAAPQLLQAAVTLVKTLASGIINSLGAIVSASAEIVKAIGSKIKSLPTEALRWGKDIILGIVKGIKAAAGAVGDAVKGVAQNIRSYLHFSVPDVGPLTDYESWMPDFMQGLAKGITTNTGKVVKAMSTLSKKVAAEAPKNLTLSSTTTGGLMSNGLVALVTGLATATPKLIKKAPELVAELSKSVISNSPKLSTATVQMVAVVTKGLTDGVAQMVSSGSKLVTGLWKGISDKTAWLKDKIKDWSSELFAFIKRLFSAFLPTATTTNVGSYLMKGLTTGITGVASTLNAAMSSLSGQTSSSVLAKSATSISSGYGLATTNLYIDSKQVVSATSPVQYSATNTKARSYGVVLA